jgi:hypothetical protein
MRFSPQAKQMYHFNLKVGFIMKIMFSTIFLLALNAFSTGHPKIDTLVIDSSFVCPVANPSYFKFYKDKFYIAKHGEKNIYVVSRSMKCEDTITTPLTRIDAMAIQEDFLWIMPDSSIRERISYEQVSDTMYDSIRFRSFPIYKFDLTSGLLIDSVVFEISFNDRIDTNYIWGLEVYMDKFVVAINGGWGPCVLFVERQEPHNVSYHCCAHPMGMVAIGNEINAVRYGKALTTFNINSEMLEDPINHILPFFATDIAYDGQNIWFCDYFNSMLHKMKYLPSKLIITPVNKTHLVYLKNPNALKTIMLDGKILWRSGTKAKQIMVLMRDNKVTKKNAISCSNSP